jgi:endonuclease YncB( thermonuclease family)
VSFTPENAPWRLPAEALRVVDGDTAVFRVALCIAMPGELVTVEREFVVRLLETDTPERGVAGWSEATTFVRGFLFEDGNLALPKTLELRLTGRRDVYGRWLGWALVDGVNLSYAINDAGHGEYRPVSAMVEEEA